MSTVTSSPRPVFSSEIEEPLLVKPVSKLAVLAFVMGLVSLFTPLTVALLPISIIAAVVGLAASIITSSGAASGAWLANVGMFVGIVTSLWTGVSSRNQRLATEENAGNYANYFLELLADGEIYKATELQLPSGGRQLPGLDLKDYYESYTGSVSDEVLQSRKGTPDPRAVAKRRMIDLREGELAKYVRKYPNAKWNFVKLQKDNYLRGNLRRMEVWVSNSEKPADKIAVVLERQEYSDEDKRIADWYVKEAKLVN